MAANMNNHLSAIAQMQRALALLSPIMQSLDWWSADQPSAQALNSQAPFCVDCLTFSQWLQWVYLPNMQHFIKQYQRLPAKSGLTPIALEAWQGCAEDVSDLLALIQCLDNLVNNLAHQHNSSCLLRLEKRYNGRSANQP